MESNYEKVRDLLVSEGYNDVTLEEEGIYISNIPQIPEIKLPYKVIDDMIELHGWNSINGFVDILKTL